MKRILYAALLATAFIPSYALAEDTQANAGSQVIAGATLSRSDIMEIQQSLNAKGFFQGSADGVWGPNTASALRHFQQQNRLQANGSLDTNTLNELGVQLSMDERGQASTNSGMPTRIGTDNQSSTNDNMSGGSTSGSVDGSASGSVNTQNNASGGVTAGLGANVGVGGNTSSSGQ